MTVAAALLLTTVADSAPVSRQHPLADRQLPGRAFAGVQIQFEVEITAASLIGCLGGILGERGPAEVGVQDDAGGVDDGAELWLVIAFKAIGGACGQGFDADLAVKRFTLGDLGAAGGKFLANGFDDAFVRDAAAEDFQGRALEDVVDGRQSSEGVGGHGFHREDAKNAKEDKRQSCNFPLRSWRLRGGIALSFSPRRCQDRKGKKRHCYNLLTIRLMPSLIKGTFQLTRKPSLRPDSLRYVNS